MMTTLEFQKLYEGVYQSLFGFAMSLTRNKEEAKDLIQETVCKAISNLHRFKSGTNFKAWISTILHNQFINEYRKKRTRKKVEAPVDDFLYAAESKGSGDQVYSQIMMNELNQILDSLEDGYRIPFLMFYKGWHYDEISDRMHLPIGTVKSRIHYARRQLREKIESSYGTLTR